MVRTKRKNLTLGPLTCTIIDSVRVCGSTICGGGAVIWCFSLEAATAFRGVGTPFPYLSVVNATRQLPSQVLQVCLCDMPYAQCVTLPFSSPLTRIVHLHHLACVKQHWCVYSSVSAASFADSSVVYQRWVADLWITGPLKRRTT